MASGSSSESGQRTWRRGVSKEKEDQAKPEEEPAVNTEVSPDEDMESESGAKTDGVTGFGTIKSDTQDIDHASDSDTLHGSEEGQGEGQGDFTTGETLLEIVRREDPDCFETASDISSDGQADDRFQHVSKKKKKNK